MAAGSPMVLERLGLVDAVDHLLNRGAVLAGEATISVAGVDLIYLGVKVLLSSVENLPDELAAGIPRAARPEPAAPGVRRSLAGAMPGMVAPAPVHAREIAGPADRPDGAEERPEQGLAKLVLTLVELLRQVVERQALHRMEGGRLTDEQVERMGQALMELEEKMTELRESFGLSPEDLEIDLGPLGGLS
jgi:hypothetical protein